VRTGGRKQSWPVLVHVLSDFREERRRNMAKDEEQYIGMTEDLF
jgi:hypothetical protein